jgi:hypothetical protein
VTEKEKIARFTDRRTAFRRQIDNASVRGRVGADEALFRDIVRLAVEDYGVSPDALEKGNRGEILEAIIESLAVEKTPTLQ